MTPEQIVEYVATADAALTKAAAQIAAGEAEKQAALAAIPAVVNQLVASGLIAPERAPLYTEKLASHADALEIFRLFAKKAQAAPDASLALGRPATAAGDVRPAAPAPTKAAAYVGQRRAAGDYAASDLALFARYGIQVGAS